MLAIAAYYVGSQFLTVLTDHPGEGEEGENQEREDDGVCLQLGNCGGHVQPLRVNRWCLWQIRSFTLTLPLKLLGFSFLPFLLLCHRKPHLY